MEAQNILVIDEAVLQLLNISQQEVIQPRNDYDNMYPNDIILYKRRFKRQQQLFRKVKYNLGVQTEQDIDRMRRQEDNNEDDEHDDDNDISSTLTSGSSYRQLPGNKRKRR
ncbi:hypothetical protein DFQ28_011573 [Apophysomyces sp. BC1034]|nr:hypothetical protein DFQ29_010137 [Apophysomyces sp. BC1021]KAG0184214.1 hypothetical protein DFQ28_011573 [Apophysomyces sp. BC1034]